MSHATDRRVVLLLQLSSIICAFNAEAGAQLPATESVAGSELVSIDAREQKRLGIVVVPLTADQYRPTVRAIATAVDIAPWLQLRAEAAVADAAVDASSAQMRRVQQLVSADQSASALEYEAAQMQFSQDQARAQLTHNQLHAVWGGALEIAHNDRLALALAGGTKALVRVEPLQVVDSMPEWSRVDWGKTVNTPASMPTSAWRAPTSISGGQIAAWFAIVVTSERWPAGLRREVQLPLTKDALIGTTVPLSAVVTRSGQTWAFVQQDATHFQRRRVDRYRPLPSGYFVTQDFAQGEAIVVAGAGLLLAELVGSAAAEED